MKNWNEQFWDLVDSYTPHHGTRIIIFLSISLSILIFAYLPSTAKALQLSWTETTITLLRATIPLSLLLSIFVLVYVLNIHFVWSLNSQNALPFKFNGKARLSLNDYYEIPGFNTPPFRIVLKNISTENMPPPYLCTPETELNNQNTETVTLSFTPHLSMHHGRRVKQTDLNNIDEETYIMCKSQLPEQDSSVFFFYISPDGTDERFFRCTVSHINTTKKEVEIDLFLKWPVYEK